MKKIFVVIISIILSLTLFGCKSDGEIIFCEENPEASECVEIIYPEKDSDELISLLNTYSLRELEIDFDNAIRIYNNYSPKIFADEEKIGLMKETQKALLEDGMNELEFFRILSPIISSIKCGHSGIMLSDDTYQNINEQGKFFGLDVRIISDEIIVVDNSLNSDISVGAKITKINGMDAEDIINKMIDNQISDGDNETAKYHRINENFRLWYYLHIDASSYHVVEYKEEGVDYSKVITLESLTNEEIYHGDRYGEWNPYIATYSDNYALLDMNSFYPFGEYTIDAYIAFIDNFFETVNDNEIDNVILDVRDNGGGDPVVSSYLFSYLAKESQPYFSDSVPDYYNGLQTDVPLNEPHFDGNLYTIMDGGSASSTGHILALLKYQDIGVFVGEESGSSYLATDSSQEYSLYYTGLNLRMSREVWDVAVTDIELGRGIMPDYEYELALSDYLSENDELLLYTISLIEESDNFGIYDNTKISLGGNHSAMITDDGKLFMWGGNLYGQLGNETNIDSNIPIDITEHFNLNENEIITSVSLGHFHSAALTSDGRMFIWGYGNNGELGNMQTEHSNVPIDITDRFYLQQNETIKEISLGAHHSAMLTSTGRVFTWGVNNSGQLGNNTIRSRNYPLEINNWIELDEGEIVQSIELGYLYSTLITSENRLFTWGENVAGQLGDGTTTSRLTPHDITDNFNLHNQESIKTVSTGFLNTLVLTSENRIFSWGANTHGSVGDGTTTSRSLPVDITDKFTLYNGEFIFSVSSGAEVASCITNKGNLFVWGKNNDSELGDGTKTNRLLPYYNNSSFNLDTEEVITDIFWGFKHSIVITSDDVIYIWGKNTNGQLGTGNLTSQDNPINFVNGYNIILP